MEGKYRRTGLGKRLTYICIPLVVVCAAGRELGVVLGDVKGPLRAEDGGVWHAQIIDHLMPAGSEDCQRAAMILLWLVEGRRGPGLTLIVWLPLYAYKDTE